MFTASDLEIFGKSISEKYIKNSIPLTEGLAKTAEAQGFTTYQIDRVAEFANTATYLNMMKTASDKYIRFEVADSKEAKKNMKSIKVAVDLSDYDDEPSIFSMQKVASAEKREATESELRKMAQRHLGSIQRESNIIAEHVTSWDTTYGQLKSLIKQAVLGGCSYGNVSEIIKVAAPQTHEHFISSIREELQPNMPFVKLDTEGDNSLTPNPNSDIYKIAERLETYTDEICQADKNLEQETEDYTKFTKEASLPNISGLLQEKSAALKVIKGIGKTIINHPKTTAALAVGAMVHKSGKNKGKFEQGLILQKKLVQHKMGRR
jgi:hypothetical protein